MRVPFTRLLIEKASGGLSLSLATKRPDRLVALEAVVGELKEENVRLEGLLDMGPDPDQNLTGDQKHSLFRTVGSLGVGTRDFHASKREQILKMSHELYALRGTSYNIINLYVDHIVGERLEPCAKDEDDKELTKELKEVWGDRRNKLPQQHESIVTDGELEGEVFMLADYFPDTDGHITLGYFPPENVRKVQKNSMGQDVLLEIDPKQPGSRPKKMYVLNSIHNDIHIERIGYGSYIVEDRSADASPSSIEVDGLVFAKFVGRPGGATRGRPRLMTVLDYIDIEDELVWSAAEREKLMRMFIMDITDNSIQTAADGDKKLREMGLSTPPTEPKVLIHNERMKIQLMNAGGTARPAETLSEVVSGKIYGSQGLPAHYSGRDSETPSGTSREQGLVPGKRLRRAQRQWIDWWTEVLGIMVALKKRAASSSAVSFTEFDKIKFKHMEVGGRDKARGAALIKDLTISLSQAVTDGLIKREAANFVLEQAFEESGFNVPNEHQGLGESMEDQLAKLQTSLVGNTKGGIKRPGNRGEQGGDDPQRREARSVRRGEQ